MAPGIGPLARGFAQHRWACVPWPSAGRAGPLFLDTLVGGGYRQAVLLRSPRLARAWRIATRELFKRGCAGRGVPAGSPTGIQEDLDMQAMNGYRGARRHVRLLGILVGLFAVAAVGMPQVASAQPKPKEPKSIYLALGDSLAFGYSQKLINENEKAGEPASAFENGYVNDYFNANNSKGKYALVNDGCPGETSASLIGNNKAFVEKLNTDAKSAIKEPIVGEAPCEYHEVDKLPLHHEYGGAGKSQLESALETITKAAAEKKAVKVVTLNIGANDILHYVGKLEAEAKTIVKAKVEAIAKKEAEEYFAEHGAELEKEYGTKDGEKYEGEHYAEIVALEKEDGKKDGEKYEGEHGAEIGKLEKEDGAKDGAKYEEEHYAEIGKLEKEDGEKDGAKYEEEHYAEIGKLEKEDVEKDAAKYKEEHEAELTEKYIGYYTEALEKGDTPEEAEAYAAAKVEAYVIEKVTPQVTKEIEAYVTEKVTPQVTKEIEAFITEQVTPQVTKEIEAFITEQVTPQVTKEIEAFITEKVTPQVTKEIEAYITEKVTPEVTKQIEAKLFEIATKDGEKYEGEHLKQLEEEGFAYVKKEIEKNVGALFEQVLTNITGILTEVKKDAPKAKIIFQGLYDPYGALYKAKEELKPGFLALAGLFNIKAKELIANKATFKGCVTNPLSIFNPEGTKEPEKLQEFTNMANTEVFEGKKDGPDIHPTPLGYEVLALQMEADCRF
jgi:hypothetical protein